jgi:4-hydroxy-tetrahydrodipicolinate synthase
MNEQELRGIIVAVITPTTESDEIDEAAFRKHLRRLIRSGVHSVFVGGSIGEGPLLLGTQWRRMAEIACDEVRGEVPLLGGAMDTSSAKVCEKVKLLRGLGYRYVVVTPTFYVPAVTPAEHLRFFGQVKDAAGDMELIAYNMPRCTGTTLPLNTVCEMATRGWIRYCKESSGNWPYLAEMIARGKDVGLSVLTGDEMTAGEALLVGARGVVAGFANYDPAPYTLLYDAAMRGDRNEVAQAMARIWLLRDTLFAYSPCWVAGMKYAVAALGIGLGKPLSPLEPCDAEGRARIDALVKADLAAKLVSP